MIDEFLIRVRSAVNLVQYLNWQFHIGQDKGYVWLQVRFNTEDVVDQKPYSVHGRKWLLSSHMTQSEIVLTAFKAVMTAVEHETREQFKYRGHAIFNPHIHVDELVGICEHTDERQ